MFTLFAQGMIYYMVAQVTTSFWNEDFWDVSFRELYDSC